MEGTLGAKTKGLIHILCVLMLATGCAGTSKRMDVKGDSELRVLRDYKEFTVSRWKDTTIQAAEGEAVILVPLYPKGFIYPVKGRIGEDGENFDALDVDIGGIHKVESSGTLWAGIEKRTKLIRTAAFVFERDDLDAILSDLVHVRAQRPESKIINLTLAILFMKKSEVLLSDGSYDAALQAINKAILYFKDADPKMYATSISRLYKSQATIHKMVGDLEKFNESTKYSLEYLMRASRYYRVLHTSTYAFLKNMTQEERFILLTKTAYFNRTHWEDADNPKWGHGFANLCDAYGYISTYYSAVGDLGESLSYCEKAVEEAKKDGNTDLIARGYTYLGHRNNSFGFLDPAESAYLTSLDYVRSEYNRWGPTFGLASILMQKKEFDSARRLIKKLAATVPSEAIGRPIHISNFLALLYMKMGEYDKAIPKFERIYSRLDFWSEYGGGSRTSFIRAGLHLCECYLETDRLDDAYEMIQRIESDLDSLGSPTRLKLQTLLVKSEIARRRGDDPTVPLKEAVTSLEEIRPTVGSEVDYVYWEGMLHVYDSAVEALYTRGGLVEALEIVEKARSRRFLDYLGSKRLGAKGTGGYRLSQNADGILESLSILEKDLVEAAVKAGVKVRNVYEEETRYTKRLENYRTALREAAGTDRQFGVTYNIIPTSPQEIQNEIPNDVTLIEYYLSDSVLYTWVLTRENIHGLKQNVSKDEISSLIQAFRSSILVNAADRGIAISRTTGVEPTKEERRLYDLLFSRIEKYIQTERVSIIPYGILNYLPFQALHDGSQYLIERFSISYIPSLSVLEFMRKRERRSSFKIVAFGNPDLNDKTLDLPAAEKEVEIIKAIFPSTEIFKRRQATEASVKALAQQYDIIHFASHGEYLPQAPLASCIRLASGDGEDGRLEAAEIFDMDLDADLVVTSACQTAIGQIRKGDEIVGLTRAFIYAGARSVLGSLWNISDEATTMLMKEFYSNISTSDESEALRQAQLKMIYSGNKYSHPFYWAAFNVTGGV